MNIPKLYFLPLLATVVLVPAVTILHLARRLPAPAAEAAPAEAIAADPEMFHIQPWQAATTEIYALLKDLETRRRSLEEREQTLQEREARLQAESDELNRLRREIDGLRRTIDATMTVVQAAEAANLRSLAKLCTDLSPPAAIGLLKEMPEGTALKILRIMKDDAVTAIIEEMSKKGGERDGSITLASHWLEQLRLTRLEKP